MSSGFSSELQGSTAALLGVTRPPGFVIKPLTGLGSRPPGFGGEISKPPGFGGDTLNRPIATPALAALPPVVKKPQSAIVAAAAAAAKALAASALAAAVAGQSADALARRKRGFSTAFSEDEGKTEEAGGKSLASERPVDNEAVTIGEEVPSAAGPGSLPATQVSAEESDRGNEEPEAEGAGVPPSLPESAPPSTPPPPPPPLSPVSPPLTCGAGPESEAGAGPPMSPMSPMLPDAPLSPMSPGSPGKESLVVQPAETSDATDMEVERGQVPDSVDNSRKCFLSTEAAAQAETDQGNKLLDPRFDCCADALSWIDRTWC